MQQLKSSSPNMMPTSPAEMMALQYKTDKGLATSLELATRKANPDFHLAFSHKTEEWLEKFVTIDPAMLSVKNVIRKLQPEPDPVLIIGPTGTGKEILAHALHGSRELVPGGKFIPVNCTALPSELLESELFGHKKGAFTGAIDDRIGKFRVAWKGTLFLDEIGDMSLDMQAKLLRVIQEMRVAPLGADKEEELTCRIVAATNRTEEELLNKLHFREDLFYRLNVFSVKTTPLSERPEDVRHIVDALGGVDIPDEKILLTNGNVRSLQAQVRRWQVLGL